MARDASSTPAGSRLLVAARTLVLDAVTGTLAHAFERAGVRCILLKGPAIARWLYEDNLLRNYGDIDFLVSPADIATATNILQDAQFERSLQEVALPHGRRPHAQMWVRASDEANVDLHETLAGVGVPPAAAWAALAQTTETMIVGNVEIEVLAEPARALLVVLHAAHHGVKRGQTLDDLAAALARVPEPTWRDATALAGQLDAVPSFAAGLRLSPEGSRLATSLELPEVSTVETVLRASSAPELALSLDWLVRTPGWRARARLVWRKLVPPRGVLKARSRLARRGALGLAAAYAVNPAAVTWRAIPALGAWFSARRQTRQRDQ